jgi:predicted ATPase
MITKIEAVNFRCLRAVSQKLGRFHVVAGPNGSGKSTFFEVPKLLAAFGRITADGTRHEGVARAGGVPLVQALLGTQDSNQGLTLLRVQHVHLLEPPPKGWSEVRAPPHTHMP